MDSNWGLLGAFVKRSCLSHVGTFNHKYPLHSCQKHFKILGGVLVFKLLLGRGTQKLCPLVTNFFEYLTPRLSKLCAQKARITASDPIHRLTVGDSSHIYRKVASTNASLFVTRLVFKHT